MKPPSYFSPTNSRNTFPSRYDGVSNHQPHDCLLNRLFGCRSKKTSKHRATGLCAGNSLGTGEFPAQMASNTENVSIWWRHHGKLVRLVLGGGGGLREIRVWLMSHLYYKNRCPSWCIVFTLKSEMWGNIWRYCQTKSHCLWKHCFICVVKYVKHLYKGKTFIVHTYITFTHKHLYKYIDALRAYQQNIRSLGLFWSAALRHTRTFLSGYGRTCYPWDGYDTNKITWVPLLLTWIIFDPSIITSIIKYGMKYL